MLSENALAKRRQSDVLFWNSNSKELCFFGKGERRYFSVCVHETCSVHFLTHIVTCLPQLMRHRSVCRRVFWFKAVAVRTNPPRTPFFRLFSQLSFSSPSYLNAVKAYTGKQLNHTHSTQLYLCSTLEQLPRAMCSTRSKKNHSTTGWFLFYCPLRTLRWKCAPRFGILFVTKRTRRWPGKHVMSFCVGVDADWRFADASARGDASDAIKRTRESNAGWLLLLWAASRPA